MQVLEAWMVFQDVFLCACCVPEVALCMDVHK